MFHFVDFLANYGLSVFLAINFNHKYFLKFVVLFSELFYNSANSYI